RSDHERPQVQARVQPVRSQPLHSTLIDHDAQSHLPPAEEVNVLFDVSGEVEAGRGHPQPLSPPPMDSSLVPPESLTLMPPEEEEEEEDVDPFVAERDPEPEPEPESGSGSGRVSMVRATATHSRSGSESTRLAGSKGMGMEASSSQLFPGSDLF
ncbi:hypothetical protein V5O48_019044, partial [Marasmius crinis-equi]